ncbi:MAG: deoxyribonuclease IV [Candidatus Omnitrophota bacterium]
MRIGLHVSIAGKIYESLERAHLLGCDTMQIFSRNPRGWDAARLDQGDVVKFRQLKEEYDIRPVVVHIPYIINLASPDGGLYGRSIKAYIDDIKRADALGAEYFVTHLGSHVGSGEAGGIKRFASAVNDIIKEADPKTTILLEVTAGSGSCIGHRLEHIRRIMDGIDRLTHIGVCLDTAHIFAAGYDIKTSRGLKETLDEFDRLIGLKLIKVVHFNDSKAPLGSHVDRHEDIGKGKIGLEALGRIINHPSLKDAAFIMETPKESEKDDMRNLAAARKLVKKGSR